MILFSQLSCVIPFPATAIRKQLLPHCRKAVSSPRAALTNSWRVHSHDFHASNLIAARPRRPLQSNGRTRSIPDKNRGNARLPKKLRVMSAAPQRKRGYLMKRKFLALSLGVGAMLLATQHVFAQSSRNCASRDLVLERLSTRFGETRQSIGLGANNAVVEVFASTETGTWTITVTLPNGVTCVVAAGQSFEALAEAPVAPGNDA